VHRAHEALRAVNARPEESRLLETEPGTALIEVVRESFDERDRLVDVVQARYPGATYVYNIDLVRPTAAGRASVKGDEHGETEGGSDRSRSIGLTALRVRR
jgi:hypothetical protein